MQTIECFSSEEKWIIALKSLGKSLNVKLSHKSETIGSDSILYYSNEMTFWKRQN